MEIIINPKKEVKAITLDELQYFVTALDLFMGEKTRLDECLCSISGSNVISDIGGGMMDKDIELLEELKGRLVEKMVIESRRTFVNTKVINKCGEYIGALSNAIQMMEEVEE